MDRFAGARYPAYTLRRFYPQMRGHNLTFAPSQYGAEAPMSSYGADTPPPATDAPGGAKGAEGTTSGWEVLGAFGVDVTKYFAAEYSADRAAARERAAKLAEARAQSMLAVSGANTQQTSGGGAVPWIVGGVLALVGVGALVYVASK
jgi:hypothetical protein